VGKNKVMNHKDLVEVFKKYFTNVAENLATKNADKN
jgi:hypothetical protein